MSKTRSEKPKKSVLRRIFDAILYIILIAVVLLFAFTFVMKLQGKPAFIFGKAFMFVETDSMEDTIPRKSFILVDKADASEIKVGDVITFEAGDLDGDGKNDINTHRVVEIIGDNEQFVTKGDAYAVQDEYRPSADNVLGKYRKNADFLSFIARGLSTSYGLVLAITFILILTLIVVVPDFRRAAKESERESDASREAMLDEAVKAEVARMMAENSSKTEQTDNTDNTDQAQEE